MSDLLEQISFIVPVTSISFIAFITSINLLKKIRQYFPIQVNCWFCNLNSKVPYNQYNAWTCPKCDQYNGFTEDGDYNCDIVAQRSIQLNKRWKMSLVEENRRYRALSPRNGLCETCNRNQEIKIQQLATFEPIVKDNFDEEIERLRVKLEKSYQLCYGCQRFLKKTLNGVMKNVLGLKLTQIGSKGLKLLDHHIATVSKKRLFFIRFSFITLLALSALNMYYICGEFNFSKKQLDNYFPPFVTHIILLVVSYLSAVKLLLIELVNPIAVASVDFNKLFFHCFGVTNLVSDFFQSEAGNNTSFTINITSIILSLSLISFNGIKHGSILTMLLWNLNMYWPNMEGMLNSFAKEYGKILIASSLCIITVVNTISHREPMPKVQSANNSFHRIYSNCDEELSDNSDDDTAFSTFSSLGKCKSIFSDSLNSVKSLNTAASARIPKTSSMMNLNHSFRSQFQQSPRANLFKHYTSDNELYHFPNKSFDTVKESTSMSAVNSSFRIPEDCQSKLIDLNISGTSRTNNRTIACASPIPSIISVHRRRSQLLTPSRLNFNGHSSLSAPVTQTSWVAGGYFVKNGMSPQKRQQQPPTNDLYPILSRTSSQSSGFESQESSVHNGNANGSRESSVAGDADHVSIYSEPAHFVDSANQMCLRNRISKFDTTLRRPSPFMPIINKTQPIHFGSASSCLNESVTNHTIFPWTNPVDNSTTKSVQPVYHQFGTQRGSQSLYGGSMDNLNVWNKFSYSPEIRKGSLLKPLQNINSLDEK